jgi:hypothetical protein
VRIALATPKADFSIHLGMGTSGSMSRLKASKMTKLALRSVLASGLIVGTIGGGVSSLAIAQEVVSQDLLALPHLSQSSPPSPSQSNGSDPQTIPQSPVALAPEIASAVGSAPQEVLRTKALTIPNTSVAGIGTSQIPVDSTQGRLPAPIPLPFGPDRPEGWSYSNKRWIPPVFCHQPTYYEDIMLENHGHERYPAIQPMISGARFYTGVFLTPYFYCLNGPFEDVSSVGRYRPGTAAPGLRQRPVYSPHAIGTQAVATGTGVWLLRP